MSICEHTEAATTTSPARVASVLELDSAAGSASAKSSPSRWGTLPDTVHRGRHIHLNYIPTVATISSPRSNAHVSSCVC